MGREPFAFHSALLRGAFVHTRDGWRLPLEAGECDQKRGEGRDGRRGTTAAVAATRGVAVVSVGTAAEAHRPAATLAAAAAGDRAAARRSRPARRRREEGGRCGRGDGAVAAVPAPVATATGAITATAAAVARCRQLEGGGQGARPRPTPPALLIRGSVPQAAQKATAAIAAAAIAAAATTDAATATAARAAVHMAGTHASRMPSLWPKRRLYHRKLPDSPPSKTAPPTPPPPNYRRCRHYRMVPTRRRDNANPSPPPTPEPTTPNRTADGAPRNRRPDSFPCAQAAILALPHPPPQQTKSCCEAGG